MQANRQVDIAVVGAGPSGLMSATVAAQAGADVVLLDEQAWAGGRLGLQTQPLQGPDSIYRGLNGVEFCRRLLEDAVSSSVEVTLGTMVSDLRVTSSGFEVAHSSEHSGTRRVALRARAAILATGSWEPWLDFPGSTLPGVMLSGDVQVRLNVHGELPGKRVLMIGSDNAGLLIAANLMDAGVEVAAVVDESPRIVGREFNAAPLREAGVKLLTSAKVVAAQGEQRVAAATVEEKFGIEHSFEVDTICLAGPRTPESKLASNAGSPLRDLEIMGGPVPVHNRRMATLVPGLYVCGDAAGVENGAVSLESGRVTGLWAAQELGYEHPKADAIQKLARARLGYLRRGRRGLLRRNAKAALASEYRRLEQTVKRGLDG